MPEIIKFSNPIVAEKYEATTEHDSHVTRQKVYRGLLSNITPEMAAAMVTAKNNLIKEKKAAANSTATSAEKAEKKIDKAETAGNTESTLVTGGIKPIKDTKA